MNQLYDVVAIDGKTHKVIGTIYRNLERERIELFVKKAERGVDYDHTGEYKIVVLEASKANVGDIIKLK